VGAGGGEVCWLQVSDNFVGSRRQFVLLAIGSGRRRLVSAGVGGLG